MPRLDIDTRRTQLIDAAIRIALRDGLDNTTVRRFDNKRALLEAVVETLLQREVDVAEFDLPDGATPVDAIKQAFRYYWTLSGAQTERQRLVYELVAYLVRQEAPGPELAQRIFANKYEVVRGFVELFQKKGEAELGLPADVIARMTVAMTDGVALAWLADGDDEKALEVLDSFAEILARTQT